VGAAVGEADADADEELFEELDEEQAARASTAAMAKSRFIRRGFEEKARRPW
jgi:hypothetical protein